MGLKVEVGGVRGRVADSRLGVRSKTLTSFRRLGGEGTVGRVLGCGGGRDDEGVVALQSQNVTFSHKPRSK